MTDSNRTQLTYIKESSFGVTPGSPSMQELRITGESLNKNISNVVSAEIRPDRQVADLIQASKEAAGDINFELSYGSFDEFFEGALFSSGFSTDIGISATDIAADATGFTSSSTDFTAANISVGQWIKVAGFTGDTANNTFYRVTSVSANDLNVTPAPSSVDAAGETVTITGSQIRNGTTQSSFTIEKGYSEISEFFKFIGMVVGQLSLNVESQQILTGGFTFVGKDGTLSSSTLDASPTASNSNDVLNAIGNVGSIREANTEVASPNYIKSLTLELNNNLRQQYAVGSDSLIGVGDGKCDVTGTVNTYFGNSDLMDKFIAGTKTSLDFRVVDSAGNTYIFDMPEVKFDTGTAVAQGQDQDIFAELGYRAIEDSTYGFTIQICKFAG
jgi:hypothetical protein